MSEGLSEIEVLRVDLTELRDALDPEWISAIPIHKSFGCPRPLALPMGNSGWVYFARARGTELVKIGFTGSNDPDARIASLQTGCPHELQIEGAVPGGAADEAGLHAMLETRHVRGEWFRLSAREVEHLAHAYLYEVHVEECPRCQSFACSSANWGNWAGGIRCGGAALEEQAP